MYYFQVEEIEGLNKKNTIIIGVSGASASGKSLLANTIVNELGSDQVVVISEDSYYKDHSNTPFLFCLEVAQS